MIKSFPNSVSFYTSNSSTIALFENYVVEVGLLLAEHEDKYEWEVAKKDQKRKDRRYLRNYFTRGCEKYVILTEVDA